MPNYINKWDVFQQINSRTIKTKSRVMQKSTKCNYNNLNKSPSYNLILFVPISVSPDKALSLDVRIIIKPPVNPAKAFW